MGIGKFAACVLAGSVAASAGKVIDPFVGHVFQWTLYNEQMQATVESRNERADIHESLRIPGRDAFALIGFPSTFCDRPDLALVGLRNLVMMADSVEFCRPMTAELEIQLSATVTAGMEQVVHVVIEAIKRLQQATVIHTSSVLQSLPQRPVRDRLMIRAGLVELNSFLLNALGSTAFLRFRKEFQLLGDTFRELGNLIGDLDARYIGCLAEPLATELRNVHRLLPTARTVDLYRQLQLKRSPNRQSLLAKFICSAEYAAARAAIASHSLSRVQHFAEEFKPATMKELYGFENIKDLIELLNGSSSTVDLGNRVDVQLLRKSLTSAASLYDRGSSLDFAQSLVEIRTSLQLVAQPDVGADNLFISHVLRAELQRMASMFSSQVIQGIEKLAHEPKMDMELIQLALNDTHPFFGYWLRVVKEADSFQRWIHKGNDSVRLALVRLVIAVTKIGSLVRSPTRKQNLQDLLSALKTCEALFKKF